MDGRLAATKAATTELYYIEVIRWFCPYCLEYYLLAYIVKHKLTMKHQMSKAEWEKEHIDF